MADYTPPSANGVLPITKTASATITGGQVVIASTASSVAPAGAGATTAVGVAAHDAASGTRVTVWPLTGVEHEVTATGTVTAGDGVQTGAAGVVAAGVIATLSAAGTLIGIATTTATGPNKVRFIGRG